MDSQQQSYYAKNKDKILASSKDNYNKNKEKILIRTKKYREENKEYFKEYSKKYRKENKNTLKESRKGYYSENKEVITKKRKLFSEKNPFRHRLNSSKKNAKTRGIYFNLTEENIRVLWDMQDGLCYYSKIPMSLIFGNGRVNFDVFSIDRIDPSKEYTFDNVVLCRWIVNQMKSDMTLENFRNEVKTLNENMK
jgi:hypothetical protein